MSIKNKQYLKKLFINTSIKMGISSVLVEKDFWVVTILDWIFNKSKYKNLFVFKGGTSLSKVHNLINRFSEDIDLIINYSKIDSNLISSKNFSVNAFEKAKKLQVQKIKHYIENDFAVSIQKYLCMFWPYDWNIDVTTKRTNVQLSVSYKSLFETQSIIKRKILLECSCFSDSTLKSNYQISSFVKQNYPNLFHKLNVNVIALDWVRTFWEKITILHSKSFANDINEEYSRHYYDVYCIANNKKLQPIIFNTINELLKVANYKKKYYYSPQSKYEIIQRGKLSLLPHSKIVLTKLNNFYQQHKEIYYDTDQISFTKILNFLQNLEIQINQHITNKNHNKR